jgi:hypothetical protein
MYVHCKIYIRANLLVFYLYCRVFPYMRFCLMFSRPSLVFFKESKFDENVLLYFLNGNELTIHLVFWVSMKWSLVSRRPLWCRCSCRCPPASRTPGSAGSVRMSRPGSPSWPPYPATQSRQSAKFFLQCRNWDTRRRERVGTGRVPIPTRGHTLW